MVEQKDRRRNLIVNRGVQRRLIASVALPLLVAFGFGVATQFVLARQVGAELAELGIQVSGFWKMFAATAVFFLIATVHQLVNALQISHRVAGSAYRLRMTIQAFRNGERSERAVLRKHDFNQDVAEELNDFLDWLNAETGAESTPAERPAAPAERQADTATALRT